MNKVYIKNTRKTKSMTRKNIVAHEWVFSPQIHEHLLTDAQQHAPYYIQMIKQTNSANKNTTVSY
jgi:hypothetical protein